MYYTFGALKAYGNIYKEDLYHEKLKIFSKLWNFSLISFPNIVFPSRYFIKKNDIKLYNSITKVCSAAQDKTSPKQVLSVATPKKTRKLVHSHVKCVCIFYKVHVCKSFKVCLSGYVCECVSE